MKKITFLFLGSFMAIALSFGQNYNKWSIGLYGGSSYLHSSQLTSFGGNEKAWINLSGEIEVTYNVTHTIGVMAYYGIGNSEGFSKGPLNRTPGLNIPERVEVDYCVFGLAVDANLSLIGRFSNKPRLLRWSWHVYGGLGFIDYESSVFNADDTTIDPFTINNILESGYAWFGTGIRYRLSRRIDFEARAKYNFTRDTTFDGVGEDLNREADGDNYFQALGGVRIKLGRYSNAASWVYPKVSVTLLDSDGDGVIDNFDKEPDTPPGTLVYGNGVSVDSDRDGIPDNKDKCINEVGIERLKGCPERTDKDEDGVFDDLDDCPNTPGPVDNAGCPKLEQADVHRLALLSKNIFFATGKSKIIKSSHSSLNEIAQIINKYPEYKFYIDGHTDNVGSSESNQSLSKRRSDAVVNYLVSQGVSIDLLIPRGFGEDQPATSNDTASGRQLNRRTEIKLASKL